MKRIKWSILLVFLLILVTSTAYAAQGRRRITIPRQRYTNTWVEGHYDNKGVWVPGYYKKTLRKEGMYTAALYGNLPRVKELVKSGSSVNVKLTTGSTPLHAAARKGHLDVVKYLVENGAEVNALDDIERTPLNYTRKHKAVAEYLRSMGAKTRWELQKK